MSEIGDKARKALLDMLRRGADIRYIILPKETADDAIGVAINAIETLEAKLEAMEQACARAIMQLSRMGSIVADEIAEEVFESWEDIRAIAREEQG